jgi:hypothetical protein
VATGLSRYSWHFNLVGRFPDHDAPLGMAEEEKYAAEAAYSLSQVRTAQGKGLACKKQWWADMASKDLPHPSLSKQGGNIRDMRTALTRAIQILTRMPPDKSGLEEKHERRKGANGMGNIDLAILAQVPTSKLTFPSSQQPVVQTSNLSFEHISLPTHRQGTRSGSSCQLPVTPLVVRPGRSAPLIDRCGLPFVRLADTGCRR